MVEPAEAVAAADGPRDGVGLEAELALDLVDDLKAVERGAVELVDNLLCVCLGGLS